MRGSGNHTTSRVEDFIVGFSTTHLPASQPAAGAGAGAEIVPRMHCIEHYVASCDGLSYSKYLQ